MNRVLATHRLQTPDEERLELHDGQVLAAGVLHGVDAERTGDDAHAYRLAHPLRDSHPSQVQVEARTAAFIGRRLGGSALAVAEALEFLL